MQPTCNCVPFLNLKIVCGPTKTAVHPELQSCGFTELFYVLRILYLGCLAHLFPEILVVEFSMKHRKCSGQARIFNLLNTLIFGVIQNPAL